MKGNPEAANARRVASCIAVIALAGHLVLASVPARAQGPPDAGLDGWKRAFAYVACAAAIVVATTTVQAWVAAVGCVPMLWDEFQK
jgi:hypothetical protein